jgi:hypothetical protein
MTELEAYRQLISGSFSLEINLNDCFMWGAAYSSKLDADDIELFLPIYQKYGTEALMAYASINDDFDGDGDHIQKYFNWSNYCQAKEQLRELADKGEIMYERHARLKQEKEDIQDFGRVIKWGQVSAKRTQRLIPKGKYLFQFARIPGLVAIGTSYYETRKRLIAKHLRRRTHS